MPIAEDWTILDENGQTAVDFTTFEDIDVRNEGEALQYPVEEGSFADYNKVTDPLAIRLRLSTQGDEADFEAILTQLEEYRAGAVVLQVATPAFTYESLTLESFSYKRARSAGAKMLTVELNLVEVREVESQTTTVSVASKSSSSSSSSSGSKSSGASTSQTASKNASSVDQKDTGKTQTQEPEKSLAKQAKEGLFG